MKGNKRKSINVATPTAPRTPPSSATPAEDQRPGKRIKTERSQSPTEGKEKKPKQNGIDNSAFGQIVFIYVGADRIQYGIHEGVLRQNSAWFKNILDMVLAADDTQNDLRDQPKVVTLADEDPAIFSRFNQWVYTAKLCTEAETPKELQWTTVFDIYTFAERRGIPKLQNDCINVIIRKVKNGGPFPSQDILNPLWKTTAKVSQLRLLLLELYAVKCDLKAALVRNGGFHHRFLHDLVIILYEMKEGDLEQDPDFWKRRHKYYVTTPENPVALD